MDTTTWIIAIDDTDNDTSIGTGRLARMLGEHLESLGLGRVTGVTRHQLLVDDRIPYTSHNSAAAIGLVSEAGPGEEVSVESLRAPAAAFLYEHFHPGADPGLAILSTDKPMDEALLAFGQRAQREVLTKDEAYDLARRRGVHLSEHGGTGQGVIGALAATGLRFGGSDGRFIGLQGIRKLKGRCSVEKILDGSDVDEVVDVMGSPLPAHAQIDTGDWVRPALVNHRACLKVVATEAGELPGWRVVREKKGTDDG